MLKKQHEEKKAQAERERRLMANPMDAEAQREIEAQIQKENIQRNLELAQDEYPEFFAQVHMLYIAMDINGRSVQAFVDSGAQSTIMSKACAEKCGILRLMDTRFAGMATGIGTSRILGRVHAAEVKILDRKFVFSFTILEDNKVDMLFGLDNLKRHQC